MIICPLAKLFDKGIILKGGQAQMGMSPALVKALNIVASHTFTATNDSANIDDVLPENLL